MCINSEINNQIHCRKSRPAVYTENSYFIPRSGDTLSQLRVLTYFLSTYSQMLGQFLKKGEAALIPQPFKFTNHLTIRRYIIYAAETASLNKPRINQIYHQNVQANKWNSCFILIVITINIIK
jgi:hypothetical protein